MQSGDLKDNDGKARLDWHKAAIAGVISLIIFFSIFLLGLHTIGGDRYQRVVSYFDQHFGLQTVFLYVLVVDTLILPLSPDFVFPIVAGMDPLMPILTIGLASAIGGMISFGIGILLDKIKFIRKLTEKANAKWGPYIKAYGIPFIMIASIFPLPFSTICTAAGAVGLDWKKALPCCFLRIVRSAIYFFLFRAGLMSII